MADKEITFLLMGRTGDGKSITGNMLLDRKKAFRSSASIMPVTKEVNASFSEFDNYRLTVVDTPGLKDIDTAKVADRETAIENMELALRMCNGGIDAFLFVIKFGSRFTEKERSALESLKVIFGTSFMKHVIVVVTGGDLFEQEMKEDEINITFDEWCQKQRGAFRQLYDDCKRRVVLMNNFERDEGKKRAQTLKILQLIETVKNLNGKYTSKSFQAVKAERDMIVELKAPELGQQIQTKASLLAADIEQLKGNPSDLCERRLSDAAKISEMK